jgi:hypothetical protein
MSDLLQNLLSPAGMAAAHRALNDRYRWFLHIGWFDRLEGYRAEGLQPRNPDSPGKPAPDPFPRLLADVTDRPEEIICVRPIDALDTKPTRPGAKFAMALRAGDLPSKICLDWSFGGLVQLTLDHARDNPHLDLAQVFVDVAHRRGSVAVYERIPASALYVFTRGSSPHNPATWTPLTTVAGSAIEVLS